MYPLKPIDTNSGLKPSTVHLAEEGVYPVFQAIPRSTLAGQTYTNVTVVDGSNKRVQGAYMSIDIAATIHTMQTNQTIMQTTLAAMQTNQTAMQTNQTAMQKQIDELKEANREFTCCLCLDKRKDTKLFCGHLLCQECVADCVNNNILFCPVCKTETL